LNTPISREEAEEIMLDGHQKYWYDKGVASAQTELEYRKKDNKELHEEIWQLEDKIASLEAQLRRKPIFEIRHHVASAQAEIEAFKANVKVVLDAVLYEYGSTTNMVDELANATIELQKRIEK